MKIRNFLPKLQPLFLISSLLYGALGGQSYVLLIVVLVWFTFTFLIIAIKKKSILYPPGFYLYMIFLIFFALNLFWTHNFWSTFWYLLVFSCGFLFWILAYNLKNEYKNFYKVIILLGIVFGILTVYYQIKDPTIMDSFSLHKIATADHHHIADLWAVVIPILILNFLKDSKKRIILLTLLLLGGYLMFMSKSRTSIISLLAGLFYLFYSVKNLHKFRKLFYVLLFMGVFLFLFFARAKPALPNRGYYLQGIAGIIDKPIGIGVGNFGEFSGNPKYHLFGFAGYSSVGMNILMEIFAGMGIFGVIFLVWFIKVLNSVLFKTKLSDPIYVSTFIVLTVNFMFDFTYLIPTMLWLWFISLGLSQD